MKVDPGGENTALREPFDEELEFICIMSVTNSREFLTR